MTFLNVRIWGLISIAVAFSIKFRFLLLLNPIIPPNEQQGLMIAAAGA